MAEIREELVLYDKFSATFQQAINMAGQAAQSYTMANDATKNYQSVLNGLDRRLISMNAQYDAHIQEQNSMISAGKQNTTEFTRLDATIEKLGATIRNTSAQYGMVSTQMQEAGDAAREAAAAQDALNQQMQEADNAAREAASGQKQLSDGMDSSTSSATGLFNTLKRFVSVYAVINGAKALADMSDQMVSTAARLDRMNDGLQTTEELNQMIYESAQRSRGAYSDTADMVAKLGTLAGGAFGSSAEIVAFAEQINKQMVLSGASTSGAQAAMLQLTQAMSSGTLRGDELNSILEQTPTIARSIADYIGVSTGKMREMASQGRITAAVVKNAMFNAAEETNTAFSQMPMTWGQVWTSMQNTAQMALQPVLQAVNWLANNIEIIAPIVLAAAAAFAVFQIATKGAAMASKVWTAVQTAFNAVMALNPVALIVIAIIALIGIVYAAVAVFNKFTGASVSATGIIAGAFFALGAAILNTFVIPIQRNFATFANFVGNLFNDPVAAVQVLFYDMAMNVIEKVRWVANALEGLINKIPGVEINLTSGLDNLYNDMAGKAQTIKDESGWVEYVKAWDYKDIGEAFNSGYDWGSNLNLFGGGGEAAGNEFSYEVEPAENLLKGISADTNAIKKSVSLTEEDIKSLIDVAERQYVSQVNLTSQTPVITVNGQNTGNTAEDRQSLADTLRDIIMEQAASGSVRTTAKVF